MAVVSRRDEVAARRSGDHTESRACSWLVGGPSFHFPPALFPRLYSLLPLFFTCDRVFSVTTLERRPPLSVQPRSAPRKSSNSEEFRSAIGKGEADRATLLSLM